MISASRNEGHLDGDNGKNEDDEDNRMNGCKGLPEGTGQMDGKTRVNIENIEKIENIEIE